MTSNAGYTAGRAYFRRYGQNDADIALLKQHGMTPTRMLTNDGQVAVMSGKPDDEATKRIALVDCQTKFKRGEGYKVECAERDANANLIAEAFTVAHETGLTPRQLAEQREAALSPLKNLVKIYNDELATHLGAELDREIRTAIAKAEGGATPKLTDDEIVELTSREAALGPDKAGGA